MPSTDFLKDAACQDVIRQVAIAALQKLAPEELDLVDMVADEYFARSLAAGQLLRPQKTGGGALSMASGEIGLLVIIPVVTGCLGNLLAMMGVWSLQELYTRFKAAQAARQTVVKLDVQLLRQLLEQSARGAGLEPKQIELLAGVLSSILLAGVAGGAGVKGG